MSDYTISGYLAALEFRTAARTLLVEGKIDRMFVERLLHELAMCQRCGRGTLTIDTTDMIKAEGNGARDLIELLHAASTVSRARFGGLVDREYRDFTLVPGIHDGAPVHRVVNDSLFWTRGHSAENYILTERSIRKYLQVGHPPTLDAISAQLGMVLECARRWAAAVSIAALEAGQLTRCSGTCHRHMWEMVGGKATFNLDGFGAALVARGVPAEVVEQLKSRAEVVSDALERAEADLARWLAHGHLGLEFAWAACAAFAEATGTGPGESEQIAKGFRDIKARIAFDDWIAVEFLRPNNGELPLALIEWCCLK